MASIPTPRSYAQILGSMVDAFLSRTGLKTLRRGDPLRSLFEAAAQSDLRATQAVFEAIASTRLETATGQALIEIAQSEGLTPFTARPANGAITVTDSRYSKVATTVYEGVAAPAAGALTLQVADASGFGSSGDLYIGRGTGNYEGPIGFSAAVDSGGYWTITLDTATTRFHNWGESVVLAQGGIRTVPAGSVVRTPLAGSSTSTSYRTLYDTTILDGEVEVGGVQVVAQQSGTLTNASASTITEFASAPFTGATCNNPLPFTNGADQESEEALRDRIRATRASRSRGTALAIKTAVVGATTDEEPNTIVSAEVVRKNTNSADLVIDDGTGYEGSYVGIAIETLVESASGGEQYFSVRGGTPVSKAFSLTSSVAPFALEDGMSLAVSVGGVTTEHTFDSSSFINIANATAYEVVASINANPLLDWAARTAENGTRVTVFAKADTQESVQVVEATGEDANEVLSLDTGLIDTLKLYKNDRLLNKDGTLAQIASNTPAAWQSMSDGETLELSIDGTPATAYTVTDAVFSTVTGLSGVTETASAAQWAAVLNAIIPGITATGSAAGVTITSNAGRAARAGLSITGGTLVSKGMFEIGESLGSASDYTLNRATGQIVLSSSLEAGDTLAAGSYYTRAFIESAEFETLTISSAGKAWFVLDRAASIVSTGVNTSTSLTFSYDGSAGTMDIAASAGVFSNVQRGDWAILRDSAISSSNRGVYRVASVAADGSSVSLEFAKNFVALSGTRSGAVATITLESGHGITTAGTITTVSNDPNYPTFSGAVTSATDTTITYNDGGSGSAALAGRLSVSRGVVAGSITLNAADGMTFVRTEGVVKQVTIPAGTNYTPSTLAEALVVEGATSEVFQSNSVRLRTDRFGTNGSIALVSPQDASAVTGFEVSDSVSSLDPQLASVETEIGECGTPILEASRVQSAGTNVDFPVDNDTKPSLTEGHIIKSIKNEWYSGSKSRFNAKQGLASNIKKINDEYVAAPTSTTRSTTVVTAVIGAHDILVGEYVVVLSEDANYTSGTFQVSGVTATTITYDDGVSAAPALAGFLSIRRQYARPVLQSSLYSAFAAGDRLHVASPFAIGPNDRLLSLVDGDTVTKRFSTQMYRRTTPIETTYSSTNRFYDIEGASPTTLGTAFGNSFDWKNFAAYMRARAVTNNGSGEEVLWRSTRYGPEGEYLRIGYDYPDEPDQSVTVRADTTQNEWTNVDVILSSGAARAGLTLRNSTKLGLCYVYSTNGVGELVYVFGLEVSSVFKAGGAGPIWTAEATLTGPTGLTDCGLLVGDKVWFESTVDPSNFPSGIKTITAVSGMDIEWEDSVGPVGTSPADDVTVVNAGSLHADTGVTTLVGTDVQIDDIVHFGNATRFAEGDDLSTPFLGASFADLTLRVDSVGPSKMWFTGRARTGSRSFDPDNDLTGSPSELYWRSIGSPDQVTFYPLNSTANTIETANTGLVAVVNALAAAEDSDVPVTGVAVGTGTITEATWDQYETSTIAPTGFVYSDNEYRVPLRDGINWVQSSLWTGAHYEMVFKRPVSRDLVYGSFAQWSTEEVRFVPVTAKGVADWLNSTAVGGLQSVATAARVDDGKVQISSNLIGSASSIQIQGGTANSVSASVVGSATLTDDSNGTIVQVKTPQVLGLSGDQWVEVRNTLPAKKTQLTTSNQLLSIAANGTFTFASGIASATTQKNVTLHFDKEGRYTRVSGDALWKAIDPTGTPEGWVYLERAEWTGVAATRSGTTVTATLTYTSSEGHGFVAGDKITVVSTDANYASGTFTITSVGSVNPTTQTVVYTDTVSSSSAGTLDSVSAADGTSAANLGWFRILAGTDADAGAFWIDNPQAVEEKSKTNVSFYTYNSFIPGDTLTIGFADWGTGNQRTWIVRSVAGTSMVVDTSEAVPEVYSGSTNITASQIARLQHLEGEPQKLLRQIVSIVPMPNSGNLSYVKLGSGLSTQAISDNYGTTLWAVDKLHFPTSTAFGRDAYRYSTGLVGEANRILYGVDSDPSTYPGIVALGANVNVVTPKVRSVSVGLTVRVSNGYSASNVRKAVQSAVVAVINSSRVGQSVSISSVIAAAQSIRGVASVVVTLPVYAVGRDSIVAATDEKLLVLDPDNILVTVSGE